MHPCSPKRLPISWCVWNSVSLYANVVPIIPSGVYFQWIVPLERCHIHPHSHITAKVRGNTATKPLITCSHEREITTIVWIFWCQAVTFTIRRYSRLKCLCLTVRVTNIYRWNLGRAYLGKFHLRMKFNAEKIWNNLSTTNFLTFEVSNYCLLLHYPGDASTSNSLIMSTFSIQLFRWCKKIINTSLTNSIQWLSLKVRSEDGNEPPAISQFEEMQPFSSRYDSTSWPVF